MLFVLTSEHCHRSICGSGQIQSFVGADWAVICIQVRRLWERIAIFNSLLVELIKLAYTVAQAGSKSVRDSGSVELFVARARVVDHRNLIHCISLVEVVNAFKHGTIRCLWKTQ